MISAFDMKQGLHHFFVLGEKCQSDPCSVGLARRQGRRCKHGGVKPRSLLGPSLSLSSKL